MCWAGRQFAVVALGGRRGSVEKDFVLIAWVEGRSMPLGDQVVCVNHVSEHTTGLHYTLEEMVVTREMVRRDGRRY